MISGGSRKSSRFLQGIARAALCPALCYFLLARSPACANPVARVAAIDQDSPKQDEKQEMKDILAI